MSEIAELLVSLVKNAGGKMQYKDLLAAVPFEQRGRIPSAMREARKSGFLSQEVYVENGNTVHNIFTVGSS